MKSNVSLLPSLHDNIARVQSIKILGVTISDRLSVNQHVTTVIASCAQTFHALRVLRSNGLNIKQRCTQRSFQGSCYSQIDLCKLRLVGFTTAHDRQRMESVIRRRVRFGYCTTNQAPLAELVAEADETLFKNICDDSRSFNRSFSVQISEGMFLLRAH